ncbi:MAG: VPLPA-CTERM sorting domain-containing protein [Gammaproteobacteria bacterium]|nr:VPLPA-CTERM sorting domain-containing protein [Gammaproteobacteria bacterium]
MIKKIIGSVALLVLAAGANANTVSLEGPALPVTGGDTFDVNVIGEFGATGMGAGGFQLFWDNAVLSLDNYVSAINLDDQLSCPSDNQPNCPNDPDGTFSNVFGNFNGLIAPDAGPTLIGTFTFTVIAAASSGAGSTSTALTMADFTPFTGGWFNNGLSEPITSPDLIGTTIEIQPIPLPAAVWLMVGGLAALARFRRS